MGERTRIPLPFGQGLDREVGAMAVRPATFEDLRNVELYDGKAAVRKGLLETATFVTPGAVPMTHIIAVQALKAERIGVVVGYDQDSGTVHVWRVQGDGTDPTYIAQWDFPTEPSDDPPRVWATDTYDVVFLAHDEPKVSKRARTVYYDPAQGLQLVDLTADLDGDGDETPIKFRGVITHLDYLMGWGPDNPEVRPDILRNSLPGQSTVFQPQEYAAVGQLGDPTLACAPSPAGLLVYKETETYVLRGSGSTDFGVFPFDPTYGIASSRLVVVVGAMVFSWAMSGPRVSRGGNVSEDIAPPLDIGGPDPAGLVAAGDLKDAFACYDPIMRNVMYVFGKRVYTLCIRSAAWQWSYREYPYYIYCAGLLFGGDTGGANITDPPVGYPAHLAVLSARNGEATLRVQNNDQTGDETIEVWTKPDAGSWSKAKEVPASTEPTQDFGLDGLTGGIFYTVAYRYANSGHYATDYSGADPDAWAAIIAHPDRTGYWGQGADPPVIASAVWSRTSGIAEQVTLTLTLPSATADTKIFRDGVLIDTILAGVSTYDDTGVTGETTVVYTVQQTDITYGDGLMSEEVSVWVGPFPAPTITYGYTATTFTDWGALSDAQVFLKFALGDVSLVTDVQAFRIGIDIAFASVASVAAGTDYVWIDETGEPGHSISYRVRHVKTAFAVDDYSPFGAPSQAGNDWTEDIPSNG